MVARGCSHAPHQLFGIPSFFSAECRLSKAPCLSPATNEFSGTPKTSGQPIRGHFSHPELLSCPLPVLLLRSSNLGISPSGLWPTPTDCDAYRHQVLRRTAYRSQQAKAEGHSGGTFIKALNSSPADVTGFHKAQYLVRLHGKMCTNFDWSLSCFELFTVALSYFRVAFCHSARLINRFPETTICGRAKRKSIHILGPGRYGPGSFGLPECLSPVPSSRPRRLNYFKIS